MRVDIVDERMSSSRSEVALSLQQHEVRRGSCAESSRRMYRSSRAGGWLAEFLVDGVGGACADQIKRLR